VGKVDLTEAVAEQLDFEVGAPAEASSELLVAIVGKRNAGKSTFINALAGQERVIVSEVPGTTRDSVDVEVRLGGRRFMLIDTAGVRKKKSLAGDIEFYSFQRAMGSIGRADVVALFIDASVKISQVDKKLSREVAEQYKPVVLVVNKWDLAENVAEAEDYAEYLAKVFPHLSYAPISLTTATEGANVRQTIDLAGQLFAQARHRMGTGELNQVIREIVAERGPSHKGGTRPPKILYATQVATAPPTIVLFVNHLKSFDETYRRYVFNQLQDRTPFAEVPIRLIFRQRRGGEGENG
jgi:GTP-binding protein